MHLHEGSGFYNPVRVSDLRGPQRYGQSVIIDAVGYKNVANLERGARQVLAKLNDGVTPKEYAFQLFNMDTFNDRSKYLEQRKSLTYFALSRVGIPAVALEVSKNITDLSWKVSQQLRGTVLFLRHFGIEIEMPQVRPEDLKAYPPKEMLVTVNGQRIDDHKPAVSLSPGAPLDVRCEPPKDRVGFSPVTAVFASDRPGYNLAKAPRLPLAPFQTLDVRSDGQVLAKATLHWTGAWPAPEGAKGTTFVCWLGGKLVTVPAGGTIQAVQGDQLVLEGVLGSRKEEVLNLKGYVSRVGKNDGQDAGQEIILDPKSFIAKFLAPQPGGDVLCEVVRETPGLSREKFTILLKPREVQSLVLATPDGKQLTVPWTPGKPLQLAPGRYTLVDVQGNGPAGMVQVFASNTPVALGEAFTLREKDSLVLRQATTFAEMGGHERLREGRFRRRSRSGRAPELSGVLLGERDF